MTTAQAVVFPEPGKVLVERREVRQPAPGEVLVRSVCSLVSVGTELIALRGAFSPGTHWADYVRYPFPPGYSTVGRVEALGAGVETLSEGELVFMMATHASHHLAQADGCAPLGPALAAGDAAWSALAGIAYVAARDAHYVLGDSVAVVGAGPVGQLSVRWARVAGASRIVAIDPVAQRLRLATAGGATDSLAMPAGASADALRRLNEGRLPRVVIDATGNSDVFADALALVGDHGRLVLVGDTGSPERQHLSSDLITRGLTVVGSHGRHLPRAVGLDGPGGAGGAGALQRAATVRFASLFFELLADGRFGLDGLVTHTFPAEDCAAAYQLAQQHPEQVVGILLDWGAGDG